MSKNIDDRLVVDFRWFTYVEPNEKNRILFEEDIEDRFGMPQPTFHFKLSKQDAERAHNMFDDMTKAAMTVGGFLPGSEPKFLPPGSSLHLTVNIASD